MRIAGGRSASLAFAVAAALTLAGCITMTPPPASTAAAEGASISFESVDGPPRPIAQRLARSLDHEATARRLVVTARGTPTSYLIRSYFAAHSEGSSTTLAWAFDVYDSARRRAFRLRGEERAAGSGAWSAVDDAVLQRIAAASIAELMTFIAADRSDTRSSASASPASSLAGLTDDPRPEAAGIARRLSGPAPESGTGSRAGAG